MKNKEWLNKEWLNKGTVVLGVVGAVIAVLMNFWCFHTEVLNHPAVCPECIAPYTIELFFMRVVLWIMIFCGVLQACLVIFMKKNSKFLWGIGFSFINICNALSLVAFFKKDSGINVHDDMSLEFQNAMLDMQMGFFRGVSMGNFLVDIYVLFIIVAAFAFVYGNLKKD